jgi:hypothetical protein
MRVYLVRLSLGLLGLVFTSACADAACAPQDIEVKNVAWSREAGWFTVTGELTNRCAEPTGVQLQLAFREANGQLDTTEDAWVANNRNLAPGETYAFKINSRGYASAKQVTATVTAVQRQR